ncbi:MAG: hypothetical protein HW402_56 [Dehalococcoidales bacterium]|nr:hypothetical protein [Dehalococcoidales bacterium]
MEKVIDQAWMLLLASVVKKRDVLRPNLGNDVDSFLAQSRLLSMMESNPTLPGQLYLAAQTSAQRNTVNIVRKLGMPADYFWKFEYWPKPRALTTLGQIVNRIFVSMMTQAKAGNLKITDLDIEPLRIHISFADCVECTGISGLTHGICYYHGGTFAGILAGLINRDLAGYETTCHAHGDESCQFIIGDKADESIKTEHNTYLSPPQTKIDLGLRLENSLHQVPVRPLGNSMDANYLQLVIANAVQSNPQLLTASNFEAGAQHGHKLAAALTSFYKQEGIQNISNFYQQLSQCSIEIKETKPELQFVIKECAEAVANVRDMEMVSFLLGELQGLASQLSQTELTVKESRFEDSNLLVTLTPKVAAS